MPQNRRRAGGNGSRRSSSGQSVASDRSTQLRDDLTRRVEQFPLLDALLGRRSRRFAKGMRLNGGPLSYSSAHTVQPLTLEEEALMVFAGVGITGFLMGDLPYHTGEFHEAGSGSIMAQFFGRTVASADGIQTVTLFVINDDGVWLVKRPQDFPRAEIAELIQRARRRELVELYESLRVRISDRRLDVPRAVPYVPPFNKWMANVPGTTYFLPVAELSTLYINLLLTALNEEFGVFFVDERNRFQPAGIARFGRSQGGHLFDDPDDERLGTVGAFEASLLEFVAYEAGAILQNLGLMAEALGLGGFPHYAAHPYAWFQVLGFQMTSLPLSRVSAAGPIMSNVMKALRRDPLVPTPLGLDIAGQTLLRPLCPPHYPTMKDAVLAFVRYKYGPRTGIYRDGGAATAFRDGPAVQASVPRASNRTISATIAFCEYVYNRYGRFPSNQGPFRTVLAYQAHHLDTDFYDRFYRPGVYADRHRGAGRDGYGD